MKKKLFLLLCALLTTVGMWADTDCTSRVGKGKADWSGATNTYTPRTLNVEMVEHYTDGLTAAGTTIFTQTITGLAEGTYTVVVYATANNARNNSGIKSDANDLVYVYAGSDKSHKAYVQSHYKDAVQIPYTYALSNVVVGGDGNLEIGMFAEKTGTQWEMIQIKSLTKIDVPEEPDIAKTFTVDGTLISDNEAFSSISATSTLEVEATAFKPIYFNNATEAFTYTPETTGTIRFVRTGGKIYVYEGNVYKGTVSTFSPLLYTSFAADYKPTNSNQLLQNPDFDVVGDQIVTNKWKFGTPWTTNVTPAEYGIRIGVSNNRKVVVWRGTKNNNYFGQTLKSLKPNTKYQLMLEQVDAGNANATFYIGIGSTEGTHGLCETSVKLGTDQNGVKTASFTTPASIVNGTTYYFTFQNTVSYNSASSGSDPVTQIDWISLEEPFSWGLTGVSSATYLNGTAQKPYTLATIAELYTETYASITTALNNPSYANIVGSERTSLVTARDVTYNGFSADTYDAYYDAISDINSLISTFTAAKSNYDALVVEIAKAKALGIDDATADSYAATSSSTAATALTSTQNLKVAEYSYVATTYPYAVELGAWTSNGTNTSAADFNNEHWSGTTHNYKNQNDSNGQGYNANSWSINFNQDVLLPAGTYVFKVAGRQAAGDKVSTSLVVKKGEEELGTVNDFPRSNNSRGINKSGNTAFEGDNSDFANGGKGYGWEWRYVKFTLDKESTVNIAVNAVATAKYQWVSFGDYTLQADNDDVANILAYNIAKADAISARDNSSYNNVTGSEKTALDNAINADPSSDYSAATTALNDARTTFITAKSSYDTYASEKEKSKLTKISANIGTAAFQYNATTNDDLYSAYETAYNALQNYEVTSATTAADVLALANALTSTTYNYQNQTLNAPDADKAYYLVHAASGLAADLGTPKLNNDAALAYPVYFVSVEGNSYKISKDKSNYVAYAGGNDWTLNTTTTIGNAAVCTFAYIGDGKYSINSTKGAFGTDGTNANSSIYGNKAADAANSAWYIYEASANLKVNSGKLGTFIAPFAIKLPEHVKAYSATVDGTTVKLAKIKEAGEELPAGTPVIIYGDDADVNVTLYGNTSVTENRTAGALVGILNESAKTVPAGSYVLQTQTDVQAFYKVSADANGVLNRCYLTTGSGNPDARLAIRFEDDATAISAIKAADAEAGALKDGKYLENGKIVIVKNGIKYSANGQILK